MTLGTMCCRHIIEKPALGAVWVLRTGLLVQLWAFLEKVTSKLSHRDRNRAHKGAEKGDGRASRWKAPNKQRPCDGDHIMNQSLGAGDDQARKKAGR